MNGKLLTVLFSIVPLVDVLGYDNERGSTTVNSGGAHSEGGAYTLNASTAQVGGVGVARGGATSRRAVGRRRSTRPAGSRPSCRR